MSLYFEKYPVRYVKNWDQGESQVKLETSSTLIWIGRVFLLVLVFLVISALLIV